MPPSIDEIREEMLKIPGMVVNGIFEEAEKRKVIESIKMIPEVRKGLDDLRKYLENHIEQTLNRMDKIEKAIKEIRRGSPKTRKRLKRRRTSR